MAELITKDTIIGDIVQKYPKAVEVLMGYGLSCVGCAVSPMETLEQGALGHGMPPEVVEKMIKDANKAANQPQKEAPKDLDYTKMDITFTDKAVDKIKEIREKEKKTESYFRVGITTGGCSGFSYLMAFEDKKGADDLELDKKGLKVVVDKQSMEMLHGCNVDFVETLKEQGFKIENPNAAKTCGCGSSFR